MAAITPSIFAVILYVTAGLLFTKRLIQTQLNPTLRSKFPIVVIGLVAVIVHAYILFQKVYSYEGINFNIVNVISLMSWLISALVLMTCITKPVENLLIAILPVSAISIILELLFPSKHILVGIEQTNIEIHILLSITAYCVLAIATVQAILLAIQDTHLHQKHPGGFIATLPPLQTMEALLFQMLGIGFVLQSFALISGLLFIEDMFGQHLVHKTFLSVLAWFIYAILLCGHWRYGWRGKTAVRWTVGGFLALMLAYLGSKLVLEVIIA